MTTIPYRPGESRVEFFAVDTEDGIPADLTDATATISISTATACIVLPLALAPDGDGFDWHLAPDTIPDLPPRAYPATLTITRGGDDDKADLVLLIEGDC